jgi:hypothetical protein
MQQMQFESDITYPLCAREVQTLKAKVSTLQDGQLCHRLTTNRLQTIRSAYCEKKILS